MLSRRELVILGLLFLVSLPAVTTRIYASDEVQFYAWLRSIAFDRDADFENEYRHLGEATGQLRGFYQTFLEDRRTESGRRINFAPIGSAVLWAPFYLGGHLIALATGVPIDGYSQPYVAAVTYGSALYGFAAVLLSAAIARRVVGRGLLASLFVAIGTPLVFYTYIAPVFGHATSAFAVSLFLWVWLIVRERWTVKGAVLLGLAGGLMAVTREQDGLLVLGPAIDFLRAARGAGVASVRVAVAGAAAFVVAVVPQGFAYLAVNGKLGPTVYAARKMTWTSPHAVSVLVSPEHGLLIWTPLVAVALAGLALLALNRVARARADAGWIAGICLVMFAAHVYMSGSVDSWTVAGAFGQRRFVAMTPILTLGLAALIAAAASARWSRATLVIVLLVCVWWNLALMMLWGANRMDRQKLDLPHLVRAVMIDLPRDAPALVWRYLTNRSSFYGK